MFGAVCPGTVPTAVLLRLHADERRFADSRSGDPRRQWIAGRCCLAAALRAHAIKASVLPRANGRPRMPAGVAGSISHKTSVSVAIATTVFEGIGLDLEHIDESDRQLATKVLTKSERERAGPEFTPTLVTMHFALKEAVYKAAPDVEQDALEFGDIEITLPTDSLPPDRNWHSIPVSVAGTSSEYRGYLLSDGVWVLAVATR